MIEAERADHVKFSNTNKIFYKERLVVCGPRLIERDNVGSRAAGRGQEVRSTVFFVKCISGKRRITMVNNAAKRESAALKDGVVSPKLAETDVSPAIIECLVTKCGA